MEKLWKSYGISFPGICTNLEHGLLRSEDMDKPRIVWVEFFTLLFFFSNCNSCLHAYHISNEREFICMNTFLIILFRKKKVAARIIFV